MKPIEKFSFQYNVEEYKLLEYVYPVAQEYAPDFDYNENTGESFMAVSQVPDIFKGRYNARIRPSMPRIGATGCGRLSRF